MWFVSLDAVTSFSSCVGIRILSIPSVFPKILARFIGGGKSPSVLADTLSFVATGEELDGISFSFDEAVLVSTSFRVRTGVRVRGFSSTRERLLDGDSLPSSD